MLSLQIAVSLGVAAIPEGLAVVITTCLALGTRKMAAKNAVVRSLPSVETLGSCSVICSDKTGTLTTNQMSVNKLVYISEDGAGLDEIDVEGTSFAPEGSVSFQGKRLDHAAASHTVGQMCEVAALCNDAVLSIDSKNGAYSIIGEPTEGALRVLVEKVGTRSAKANAAIAALSPAQRLHRASRYYEDLAPRLATYEFSRDRKSMSVLVRDDTAQKLLVKGAPESILDRCSHALLGIHGKRVPINGLLSSLISNEVVDYGNRGLRVIAFASVDNAGANPLLKAAKTTKEYTQIEQGLTLIGLCGMLDPPRPEVRHSIAKCRSAGIRVIVVTGDNQNTAESICRQIGVFGPDEDLAGKSYTGREFDSLDEAAKVDAAKRASLFSRTEPTHKSKLVDLLQQANEVVAMTGDGVNDAPALKKADIGVAMGSGTDVARLAADMVLADDNFATIESAVEEGRSIYSNTQQFIRYLISSNIGEVVSIFLTAALGMPEALIPVQLLWVNLVTDGLPATALSFNPPDHDVMKRPPRKRDDGLVDGWLFFRYMVIGTYVGWRDRLRLCVVLFAVPRRSADQPLPAHALPPLLRTIPRNRMRHVRKRHGQNGVNRVAIHPGRHRDAQRHERAVVVRVARHAAAVAQHGARVRNCTQHGAAFCAALRSAAAKPLQCRLSRLAGVDGCRCHVRTHHVSWSLIESTKLPDGILTEGSLIDELLKLIERRLCMRMAIRTDDTGKVRPKTE